MIKTVIVPSEVAFKQVPAGAHEAEIYFGGSYGTVAVINNFTFYCELKDDRYHVTKLMNLNYYELPIYEN